MKIIIIGAGRVGSSFGFLLKKAGFKISGVFNKHYSSTEKSAERIGEGIALEKKDLLKIIALVDLVLITTPDDQIKKVAEFILKQKINKPLYLMHMSGLHSSEILNPDDIEGVFTFSLHPLQSIPDFKQGVNLLPTAFYSLEGKGKGLQMGEKLVEELNLKYIIIDKEYKSLYHSAAVFASNYLLTIMKASYDLLDCAGVLNDEMQEAVLNLVKGTLQNLQGHQPEEVLTGPVARRDNETIKKHIRALQNHRADYIELYNVLKKYTERMIKKEEGEENEIH